MSWRIKVVHRSIYHYSTAVTSSYNEARITPLTTPNQLVLDATVSVRPAARVRRYWDYWGAVVHAFDLHEPHDELEVTGSSVVEVAVPGLLRGHLDWADLRSEQVADDFAELLAPTTQVPLDDRLLKASGTLANAATPGEAVQAAVDWVRSNLEYAPGATEVHTSAVEAFEGRRGVCQDFAHVALALIRGMGIPARYCSGYLHPNADAGIGAELRGESHAWIEAWNGDWIGVDPTIGWPVGERHVLVARGRDYADVSPLKGIYQGGATQDLKVDVLLTRVA